MWLYTGFCLLAMAKDIIHCFLAPSHCWKTKQRFVFIGECIGRLFLFMETAQILCRFLACMSTTYACGKQAITITRVRYVVVFAFQINNNDINNIKIILHFTNSSLKAGGLGGLWILVNSVTIQLKDIHIFILYTEQSAFFLY